MKIWYKSRRVISLSEIEAGWNKMVLEAQMPESCPKHRIGSAPLCIILLHPSKLYFLIASKEPDCDKAAIS